jgi:hypothetical protein
VPLLIRTAPTARRSRLQALADRVAPAHLAMGRAGAGAVMVLRPRALPQLMGVDSATAARLGWSLQMLGARELALGLGTLASLRRTEQGASRTWVAAGVLCDAVDVLVVGGALARGRVSKGAGTAVLAVAAGAVALGARALQEDEALL